MRAYVRIRVIDCSINEISLRGCARLFYKKYSFI
nr:MAG TPA_asm: hypothetical protein [Caudoviricetes sp.]